MFKLLKKIWNAGLTWWRKNGKITPDTTTTKTVVKPRKHSKGLPPTLFRYRAAAVSVMKKMANAHGDNLTIAAVINREDDSKEFPFKYKIVKKDA